MLFYDAVPDFCHLAKYFINPENGHKAYKIGLFANMPQRILWKNIPPNRASEGISFNLHSSPPLPMIGWMNCDSVSQRKRIQVSWLTSVI